MANVRIKEYEPIIQPSVVQVRSSKGWITLQNRDDGVLWPQSIGYESVVVDIDDLIDGLKLLKGRMK